jgi:hypothetical protein
MKRLHDKKTQPRRDEHHHPKTDAKWLRFSGLAARRPLPAMEQTTHGVRVPLPWNKRLMALEFPCHGNKRLKALEFRRRFVIVVQAEQQVRKRLGAVRLDVDRVAIRRNCLIVLALIFERITEVGISQVRFNVYRLAVCGDCFLELTLVLERNRRGGFHDAGLWPLAVHPPSATDIG